MSPNEVILGAKKKKIQVYYIQENITLLESIGKTIPLESTI